MSRFSLVLASFIVAAPAVAVAQPSPAERADQLNDEGKDLYRQKNYDGAIQKFRQAVVLSPEGRFYFNLCYTLHKMGRNRDALTACEAINTDNSTQALVDKTAKLIKQLRPLVAGGGGGGGDQPPPPPDDGGGDQPPPPDDGGGDTGGGGGPPPPPPDTGGGGDTGGGLGPQDPYPPDMPPEEEPLPGDYSWSLGAELGPVRNVGLGRSDNDLMPDAFDDAGLHVKLYINFLLANASNIGLQGYLNITNIGGNDEFGAIAPGDDGRLSIADVGGGLFQHRHLGGKFWLSYMGGAHIALMSVGSVEAEAATSFGFHGELSLSWLLGSQEQHELRLTAPSFNFYLPATGGTGIPPEDVNLDQPGATWAITFGYVYRFKEAFGTAPIFTLE